MIQGPINAHALPPGVKPGQKIVLSTMTPAARDWIARSMYGKGKAFLAASELLAREMARAGFDSEPSEYAVLNLLCQGTEVAFKGLLLAKDFRTYWPRMRPLGHDLAAVVQEAAVAYKRKPPAGAAAKELAELSAAYGRHQLRYGAFADIFFRPQLTQRRRFRRYVISFLTAVERAAAVRMAKEKARLDRERMKRPRVAQPRATPRAR